MSGLRAGDLRWQVTILQQALADDGFTSAETGWAEVGTQRAIRKDVSDAEKLRAGQLGGEVTTRFVVRQNPTTLAITARDRLRCDGVIYRITGIKESIPRVALELSTVRASDA